MARPEDSGKTRDGTIEKDLAMEGYGCRRRWSPVEREYFSGDWWRFNICWRKTIWWTGPVLGLRRRLVDRMMKTKEAVNRTAGDCPNNLLAEAAAAEHLVVPDSRKDTNERISPFAKNNIEKRSRCHQT
ncbi:Hypothetical predicted protein [Olea europaea subsp. europaea]|uniref:Uncharacterized protein n=1 Tax=Olea europaea subsp. europaea TaxID=158383 RepID=A0A8S0S5J1_OLEEU|nr:Hypothetical predicted protein [Olea europaea subsp. europaea]